MQTYEKTKQEEKIQMYTNQLPVHMESIANQQTPPILSSTTKTNKTDSTSQKCNTAPAKHN